MYHERREAQGGGVMRGKAETIGEARTRLKHELYAELVIGNKTIQEALTVEYDHKHRIRQRLLLWFSNFGLMIAGSKHRGKIVK